MTYVTGRPYGQETPPKPADVGPSPTEIHWLSGFLEGEGSFYNNSNASMMVTASSCDESPLRKCKKYFGGKVYGPYHPKNPKHSTYWRWTATGPRAVGIGLTMYPLLSPRRREQVETMIERNRDNAS